MRTAAVDRDHRRWQWSWGWWRCRLCWCLLQPLQLLQEAIKHLLLLLCVCIASRVLLLLVVLRCTRV
jgi:hypothetical protein